MTALRGREVVVVPGSSWIALPVKFVVLKGFNQRSLVQFVKFYQVLATKHCFGKRTYRLNDKNEQSLRALPFNFWKRQILNLNTFQDGSHATNDMASSTPYILRQKKILTLT